MFSTPGPCGSGTPSPKSRKDFTPKSENVKKLSCLAHTFLKHALSLGQKWKKRGVTLQEDGFMVAIPVPKTNRQLATHRNWRHLQ